MWFLRYCAYLVIVAFINCSAALMQLARGELIVEASTISLWLPMEAGW